MIRNIIYSIVFCLFLSVGVVMALDTDKEKSAVSAAERWHQEK
jgi:hypothetical protein